MPVKRFFLKGVDYFQLLIDHHSRRLGGPGHQALLAVHLDGAPGQDQLTSFFEHHALCRQLAGMRVSKTYGLGYPSLTVSGKGGNLPVDFVKVDGNEIPSACLNKPVDVYRHAPLLVQVLYFKNKTTCLLFTFHHILFDFAGVQSFVQAIRDNKTVPLFPGEKAPVHPVVRIRRFFRAVFFTFREANRYMTVAERKLPSKKPLRIQYRETEFSETETERIYDNGKKLGVELNPALFQLACVSMALHKVVFSKQKRYHFIWVPVPVNVRRKGEPAALLFNGLTFLFYKLKPAELLDLPVTLETIRHQMMKQVREELPAAFIDFADGYRFMPMPFYYPMMKLPSWGRLSTFSFSTLGKTFEGFTHFMGLPVLNITNYPSNSIAPGFTFLFYEFRGRLRCMSSWVAGQFTGDEQMQVENAIREGLLQMNPNQPD